MKKQEGLKPRILIDQNIGLKTGYFLKSLGLDVKTLADLNLRGKEDIEISLAAEKENRTIITFDKDLGRFTISHQIQKLALLFYT